MNVSAREALPEPARDRFQPLRLGLVDIYRFDEQEFRFRDGRLLLRGHNGTGKSKVLALTLPFLLDGDMSPHRVEPDGDPAKRMEWNLLMDGRYSERVGYSWMELGRMADDGARFITIGCGMKAVQGRGAPQRWFFVTDRRIGLDLHLVSPSGHALSRERLRDALGGRGTLTDTAESHRRVVDETLFSLGEARHAALVSLLVQLRQPQLSKRPDERKLSAALSEALAPVDARAIGVLADGFHGLEHDRLELDRLRDSLRAIEEFVGRYRRYAGIVAVQRAASVRQAHVAHDRLQRERREAEEKLERARQRETSLLERMQKLRVEQAQAEEGERALLESPAMREAQYLAAEDKRAGELHAAWDAARGRRKAAAGVVDERKGQLEQSRLRAELRREQLEKAAKACSIGAARVGLGGPWEPMAHAIAEEAPPPSHADRDIDSATARRAKEIGHVETLCRDEIERRRERDAARARHDEIAGERDEAADLAARSQGETAQLGRARMAAARTWADAISELQLDIDDAWWESLAEWTMSLNGGDPLVVAAACARDAAIERLASARSRLEQRGSDLASDRQRLQTELDRLRGGVSPEPWMSTLIDQDARRNRPGAPLHRLIDFRGDVDERERAGLEAALEASGLLGAWLTPEGTILGADTNEIVIVPSGRLERNLGEVLLPARETDDAQSAAVSDATIARVLEGIGRGEQATPSWMDTSGRFRLGVMQGSACKAQAEHVGAGARAEARSRRITLLVAELAAVSDAQADLARQLAALSLRAMTVDNEHAALPSAELLMASARRTVVLVEARDRVAKRLSDADARVGVCQAAWREALTRRDDDASALGLPTEAQAVQAVRGHLEELRRSLAALLPVWRGWSDAAEHQRSAIASLDTATADLASRARDVSEAEVQWRGAKARVDTLRATVGDRVDQIRGRVERARGEVARLKAELEGVGESRLKVQQEIGGAEALRGSLDDRLSEASATRQGAVDALRRFSATGLLLTAVPALDVPDLGESWAPTPAARLARSVEAALADVDTSEQATSKAQRDVQVQFQALAAVLSAQGHPATLDVEDSLLNVGIAVQGERLGPTALASRFGDEVTQRQRLLTVRERELIEHHLVQELASHLVDRIREAEESVQRINEELHRRPTMTGMRLRLQWKVDESGPEGLAEARARLLRQRSEAWSPEDRIAIGRFLQDHLERVRADSEGATWNEQLAKALDYRRWHRFEVERYEGNRWKPAVGPASGGERVLVVTLPLLAAAASHASSAAPYAPRLVLMDEAFAGVDDAARAQCFGLLEAFELDYVLTSEREWGCHAAVSGLSIAQLSRREGIDAVHVSHWEWDGRRRQQQEHGGPSSSTKLGTASASPAPTTGSDARRTQVDGRPIADSGLQT